MAGCAAFALGTGMACAAEWYVATSGSDAAAGTNWLTAKQTIQAGVDAATDGDTVWVSNGVYATGGTAVAGDWTNRVAITKPILVQSMNGPAETFITGGVVRCAYVTNGAVLSGFTLTGGRSAEGASGLLYDKLLYGGGAWCEAEGVLTNCVVQGNRGHWGGGGVRGGRLDNCVLIGNWTERGGGGTYESQANHCLYSNNWAHSASRRGTAADAEAPGARPREVELRRGGAAYGGVLNHCVLEQNESWGYGGATYYAALDGCMVKGNFAADGCAAYGGSLSNCIVTGNQGDGHAVLYDCTLANCLVANNHNDLCGTVKDCTLFNCTVTANSSYQDTGGAHDSTLYNCIVYGNSAGIFSDSNHLNSTFYYSCTAPDPGGTGNLADDPQFVDAEGGDFRLATGSPCINAGDNNAVSGETDLDGNPRIMGETVDMGAYEVFPLAIAPSATNLPFEGTSGNAIEVWAIAPWTAVTNAPWLSIASGFSGTTSGTVVFNAASNNGTAWRTGMVVVAGGGMSLTCTVIQAASPIYSVNWHVATNGSDAAAGTNWATAKQTIQAAVDEAGDGDTVWVSNGVYATGGRVRQGRVTNRIVLDKAVRVESLAGPLDTAVLGGDRTRCAYVGAHAVLSGFTLMDGQTWDDGMAGETNFNDHFGGGAWCEPSGAMSNCWLIQNSASHGGGGVYQGLLTDCRLQDNYRSQLGGAAYGSSLRGCLVSNNQASHQGGGTYDCRLWDCTVIDNWGRTGVRPITVRFPTAWLPAMRATETPFCSTVPWPTAWW